MHIQQFFDQIKLPPEAKYCTDDFNKPKTRVTEKKINMGTDSSENLLNVEALEPFFVSPQEKNNLCKIITSGKSHSARVRHLFF